MLFMAFPFSDLQESVVEQVEKGYRRFLRDKSIELRISANTQIYVGALHRINWHLLISLKKRGSDSEFSVEGVKSFLADGLRRNTDVGHLEENPWSIANFTSLAAS